ncbi:c-type cytochrome biogenesis protein CcmI [Rhabdochromatium marinum]|uniref:c-type cytochrome biogenesis protein CcmI n=1 Tax=Rhabdochromatium marinum TaxID=48729 RepID=UPI001903279B|nr:c-type cytochrome biogenesis protein CcmI [Rhabdochromatium marinum]MBK1647333.1 c-type cytochrome biogenesis protein CcmI [Rhabdochromatium marinum]
MTLFWTLAGALMLLAFFVVLVPLLRRRPASASLPGVSQDAVNLSLFRQQMAELDTDLANGKIDSAQHQSAKLELERELLHDIDDAGAAAAEHATRGRWLLPLLALAVPALALAFYQATGTPQIIPRLAASATQAPVHGSTGEMPPLDVLAERLAARMEQNPEDIEGWMMLGRTYFAMGQPAPALKALQQAYALAPDNLDVKLTYAEALAANNDNQLEGQPAALISEVLAADPDHINARWLNGMLSFQRGQYTAAIQSWQRVLEQIDPASSDAEDLRGLIAEARQRGGLADEAPATVAAVPTSAAAPKADKPAAATPAPAAAAPGQIEVNVAVAPEFAESIDPSTAVFIYAKAAAGPPMPLAAQRVTLGDLPMTVTLDDSLAINPALKLSSFPTVIVGARISASGQAMPMPGDPQGETGPLNTERASAPIQVLIDQRRP